jgi:hypothetical protein
MKKGAAVAGDAFFLLLAAAQLPFSSSGIGSVIGGTDSGTGSAAGMAAVSAFLRVRVSDDFLAPAARLVATGSISATSGTSATTGVGIGSGVGALLRRVVAGLRGLAAFFGAGAGAAAVFLAAAGLRAVLAAFFGAAAVVFLAAEARVVVALRAVLAAVFFGVAAVFLAAAGLRAVLAAFFGAAAVVFLAAEARVVAALRAVLAAVFFGAAAVFLAAAGLRAVLAAFFGAAAVVFLAAEARVVVALRAVLAAAFFGAAVVFLAAAGLRADAVLPDVVLEEAVLEEAVFAEAPRPDDALAVLVLDDVALAVVLRAVLADLAAGLRVVAADLVPDFAAVLVVLAAALAGAFLAGAAAFLVVAGLRPAVLALRVPAVRRLVLTAIGRARPGPVSLSSLITGSPCLCRFGPVKLTPPTWWGDAAWCRHPENSSTTHREGKNEAAHAGPFRHPRSTHPVSGPWNLPNCGAGCGAIHDAGLTASRESHPARPRTHHAIFTPNLLVNEIRKNALHFCALGLHACAFFSAIVSLETRRRSCR